MAVTGDFFVEVLEDGGDEDESEVLVWRFDLELLQHLGKKGEEVL